VTLIADVTARLAAQIPSRTVYAGAVPDGTLPQRYLVVWASEGSEESTRLCDTTNVQTPTFWVTSVARNARPNEAAQEAAWGASKVRAALRDWRPDNRWKVRPESSQPALRDESASTTFYAVEQFTVRLSLV
jgi:hypothetical protein